MFLISSLIINHKVTNGSIIQIDKISNYFPDLKKNDIEEILKCFVSEKLIIEQKHYQCKNGHDFTPKKQDYEYGYDCLDCASENIDEEDRFIESHDLEKYFCKSTYKINKINQDVWNAISYTLNGDYNNAVIHIRHALIEEDPNFDSLDKKDKLDRASKIFTIGGQGTNIMSKTPELMSFIEKLF